MLVLLEIPLPGVAAAPGWTIGASTGRSGGLEVMAIDLPRFCFAVLDGLLVVKGLIELLS